MTRFRIADKNRPGHGTLEFIWELGFVIWNS
jgi:hypothetical protein